MDVQTRGKVESGEVKCEEAHQHIMSKSVKRPFDVAFLMLPDEKLKEKQRKLPKSSNFGKEIDNNNDEEDVEVEIEDSVCELKGNRQSYFTQKQQIFDDPGLIKLSKPYEGQKSAFTKVNLSKEARMSPSLSLSPDINYQNSLSPSPPIANRQYQGFPASMLPQNQIFKSSMYQGGGFMPENFQPQSTIEGHFLATKAPELMQPTFPKLRPAMYRPDLAYNYHQFPNQDLLKIASPAELKFGADVRGPAAAILTSLLPPSLAALSLPGQNVCAKCNITFRMTSDLVYHMRSHHKNDANDMHKRRREEKLKCPVCAESFRERHHLTRHMTAHQDKDDDDKESKKDGH
ncbi:uncharacterized protein [Euwallacea fornicatus]|uniref:uncharacterized protein n=1 Tax=Euwallacea fornicatus TaxID=995702 RepID=UPI00338EC122